MDRERQRLGSQFLGSPAIRMRTRNLIVLTAVAAFGVLAAGFKGAAS
jgi:hypothetical protein